MCKLPFPWHPSTMVPLLAAALLAWGSLGLLPSMAANEAPVFDILPSARQGETISVVVRNVSGHLDKGTAKMGSKSVPLFLQDSGDYVGLIPIGVYQKPGAYTVSIIDGIGVTRHQESIQVGSGKFPVQNISVSPKTKGLEPLPGEMEAIGALKNTVTRVRHWQEPFISPTPDCMNSRFGVRRYHNGKDTGNYHKGIDLRAPYGRPVKAITAGQVHIAKMFRLHGGTIGIDHGQGVSSIYIHMSKLVKGEGDAVQAGETVGYVGSTGFATGPHLHWGLYVNGLPVDPIQWLPKTGTCL